MKDFGDAEPRLFEAFIKMAQYMARLKSQQDIWEHLGKFLETYFPAAWTAFLQRDSDGGISIHNCTLPDSIAAQRLLTNEVRSIVADLLENGFLASHVLFTPEPSPTVFLPVMENYQTSSVMLIGHKTGSALPRELLNIYLAIAGLAGTTLERVQNERELNRHRAHLEELIKERTAELAQAKRQNELILQSAGEGICGIDLEGKITFINPSAARCLGYEPEELIGRDAHSTFHYARPDGSAYSHQTCPVHLSLRQGHPDEITNEEFYRRDGTCFPVEFTASPLIEAGAVVGGVIVFRDISERKRAGEALLQAKMDLEQANKELENRVEERTAALQAAVGELQHFSYTITHDMRAPLRAMRGYGNLLLEQNEDLGEKSKHFITRIGAAAHRMDKLITDALDYSKLVNQQLDLQPIDCGALLVDMIDSYPQYQETKESIVFEGTLPAVMGNEAALTQCFSNLLNNAIKFVQPGQTPRIRIRAEERGEWVRIWFEDNGIGIQADCLEKVFGMFQRLSVQHEGTGIGLALVKKAAERMGGKVGVESELGKGSRFWLEFKKAGTGLDLRDKMGI